MNKIFETYQKFAELGMTSANVLELAKGFRDWQMWQEIRVLTPCPIIYRLEDGTIVQLPFLDVKAQKEQIIGIAIDDVCFLIWEFVLGNIPQKHIECALDKFASEKFEQKAKDCRLILPSVEMLGQRRNQAKDFAATINILQQNGINANNWRETNYWAADNKFVIDDHEGFHIKEASQNARRHCCLRPVIQLLPTDMIGRYNDYGVLDSAGQTAFWKLKRA